MNIVLVTNILTPYRKVFYDELYKQCQDNGDTFHVLVMAHTEPGRHWNYDDFKTNYTTLLHGKLIKIGNIYTIFNTNLKKELKKLEPNIVIASGSYMITTVWKEIYLASKLNYKLYYWSESHDEEERKYNKFKLLIREKMRKMTIGRFDGFWFAGQKSKALLEKYAKPTSQYIFVPNLVDSYKFKSKYDSNKKMEIRKEYSISNEKRVWICPARLHPAKGLVEFLELFSKCRNTNKITILIPGDGELYDELSKSIKEKSLDVRLMGYKTEDEMIRLYSISDVFLLPSKSDPNPLSCIEACWQGLPLLVSNHVGNYPELIERGVNGQVFDYSNEKESIGIIESIIDADEKWLERASEYSKKIAIEKYDSKKEVARILETQKLQFK